MRKLSGNAKDIKTETKRKRSEHALRAQAECPSGNVNGFRCDQFTYHADGPTRQTRITKTRTSSLILCPSSGPRPTQIDNEKRHRDRDAWSENKTNQLWLAEGWCSRRRVTRVRGDAIHMTADRVTQHEMRDVKRHKPFAAGRRN